MAQIKLRKMTSLPWQNNGKHSLKEYCLILPFKRFECVTVQCLPTMFSSLPSLAATVTGLVWPLLIKVPGFPTVQSSLLCKSLIIILIIFDIFIKLSESGRCYKCDRPWFFASCLDGPESIAPSRPSHHMAFFKMSMKTIIYPIDLDGN